MKDKFVVKLKTDNYLIGSFDVYMDEVIDLIKTDPKVNEEKLDNILKSMPTSFRGAILSKDGDFIGYIGLYNVDEITSSASIRFEVNKELEYDDNKEIVDEFKKYVNDSLNIRNIEEFLSIDPACVQLNCRRVETSTNVIIPNNMLVPGISEEVFEKFSQDYSIPRLQMPFTIVSKDKVLGIIGLSNVIWSNKRANLNIFLDKSFDRDITNELSSILIDNYIDYLHSSNVHSINLWVPYSDDIMIDLIKNTNMNYYGSVPYGAYYNGQVENGLMFQHIPNLKKDNEILLPENKVLEVDKLDSDKKELSSLIELDNGYRLVSPKILSEDAFNHVLEGFTKTMENRDRYTIPIGEDKYMLQVGNGKYGLSKALSNFTYIIIDDDNNYVGCVNKLRENANGRNVEIEIGVAPSLQHMGIGTMAINAFYDELFSIGYASITSNVFEFNNPSIKLHEKVAELNGIRLDSYYINGRLWNMGIYTKMNDINETNRKSK